MIISEKIELGWKQRELHNFTDADKLLLESIDELTNSMEDPKQLTEAINHYVYSLKMQGQIKLKEAAEKANKSLKVATDNNIDNTLSLRAAISANTGIGFFEQSLKYAKEYQSRCTKPFPIADSTEQVAYSLLRTGRALEAQLEIDIAYDIMLNNDDFKSEREPHQGILKLKIYITKILIEYNLNNTKLAKELYDTAIEIANEKEEYKHRKMELEALQTLFN